MQKVIPPDSLDMNFTVCGTKNQLLFSPHKSSEATGKQAIRQENITLMRLSICRMANI
jgi:hypothetical protein